MDLFIYLGGIIAIFIDIIILNIMAKIIMKKRIPQKRLFKYFSRKLPKILFFDIVIMMIICILLPIIIWQFGKKEINYKNEVKYSKEIFYNTDKKCYVYIKKDKENCKNIMLTTIENENKTFDLDEVNLIYIKPESTPKVEESSHYKLIRLKGKNFIIKSVNEIFCPISGWKERLEEEKINVYIQKNLIGGNK